LRGIITEPAALAASWVKWWNGNSLVMTGLKREGLMADLALAMQPMLPPGGAEIEHLNREAFATKQRFFREGEISVHGRRWN
jgi:hypothetical protein